MVLLDKSSVKFSGVMRVEPANLLLHDRPEQGQSNLQYLSRGRYVPERHLGVAAYQRTESNICQNTCNRIQMTVLITANKTSFIQHTILWLNYMYIDIYAQI